MAAANSNEGLKRVIGVPGLTLSIISGVIGAGIFVLPAVISSTLGAFAIFGYIVCGLLMATILLCYAESGSRITTHQLTQMGNFINPDIYRNCNYYLFYNQLAKT